MELFEKYILKPLFDTKTILSPFNIIWLRLRSFELRNASICGASFGVMAAGYYELFGSFGGEMSELIKSKNSR